MSRTNQAGSLAVLIAALASTAGARELASPNLEPTLVNGVAETEEIFANGFETFTLTIDNYIAWCSITVDGGPPSAAISISKSFPDGTLVSLQAVPVSDIFVWGYWADTDAAKTDANQSIQVTMSADRHFLACCPFKPPASQTCP
jgi:hypothetical protein